MGGAHCAGLKKGRMVPVEEADEAEEESSVKGEGGMLPFSSSSLCSERTVSSESWWVGGIGGSRGR